MNNTSLVCASTLIGMLIVEDRWTLNNMQFAEAFPIIDQV
jgi:hypothetical protein